MIEGYPVTGLLIHAAALSHVAGFLMRDQLHLRWLLLAGSVLYALYYLLYPSVPLYDAAAWSAAMIVANLAMIARIRSDRRPGRMGQLEAALHRELGEPTPGHFRRLIRAARPVVAAAEVRLTEAGTRPGKLFLVHAGEVQVETGDGAHSHARTRFIGEIAYLMGGGATATVTLPRGGAYLEWDYATLDRLTRRAPGLRTSLETLLTRDMARKLGAP